MYDAKSAKKVMGEELRITEILSDRIVKGAMKVKIEYVGDSIVKGYKTLIRFVSISKWVSLSFLALFTPSVIFGKNSEEPKKLKTVLKLRHHKNQIIKNQRMSLS